MAATMASLVTAVPVAAAPKKTDRTPAPPDSPVRATSIPQPVGDFSNPPPKEEDLHSPNRPSRGSFDPATSKLIDAETTPTKLTYLNADGTRTDVVTQVPTRVRDAQGNWVPIDLSLTRSSDGKLRAKSSEKSAKLASRADDVTSLEVADGSIEIRHPDASPVQASVEGGTAKFARALGRRDLHVTLREDGVEEFVVLPDTSAGGSYALEVSLPKGLTARDGDGGVEFIDASGTVVAIMHHGIAEDSTIPVPSVTPVTVQLVAPEPPEGADAPAAPATGSPTTAAKGATATNALTTTTTTAPLGSARNTFRIQVSIDSGWLTDPARVPPVTIDPSTTVVPEPTASRDAMVLNNGGQNTPLGKHQEAWVSVDTATNKTRSYFYFDLPAAVMDKWVNEAHLTLDNFSNTCSATAPPALAVGAARAPWYEVNTTVTQGTPPTTTVVPALTWNTQANISSPIDPDTGTATPSPSCATTGQVNLDTTWLVWKWAARVDTNYGFVVTDADEANTSYSRGRKFRSNDTTTGVKPTLWITYGTGTPPLKPAPVAPDDMAIVPTLSPTLTVNQVTDADPGDTVRYWFRGTPTSSAEDGYRAIDSGWISPAAGNSNCALNAGTCSYTVPSGQLQDGETYTWRVWAYDGNVNWVPSDLTRTFTVDLHVGADGLPSDAFGPLSVNLASGNLTTAVATPTVPTVGGSVGLNFVYNSLDPSPRSGLVGSYFSYDGSSAPAAPFDAAKLKSARIDPTINFDWAIGARPSPAVAPTGFAVRWEGYVTVPVAGEYRFGATADDGVRIYVNDALVLDRWENQWSWMTPHYSGPVRFDTAATTKKIRLEYYKSNRDDTRAALVHLLALSPGQQPNTVQPVVPASWLSHDSASMIDPSRDPSSALPQGWILSPTGLSFVSARVSDGAAILTDPTGAPHRYRWTGSGFEPPDGEDGTLVVDDAGVFTLQADDGISYVFDQSGRLAAATSPLDDGSANLNSTVYAWSNEPGKPRRLTQISDPVATRLITIRYQGLLDSLPCPAPAAGETAPGPFMPCQIDYAPSAISVRLRYANGPDPAKVVLSRIENPGDGPSGTLKSDFSYDTQGRLQTLRTPLANDALPSGYLGTNPDNAPPSPITESGLDQSGIHNIRTLVWYGADARVSWVKLPVPNQGEPSPEPRPRHRYVYSTTGASTVSQVQADGHNPDQAYPFLRKVAITHKSNGNLEVVDTDATGKSSTSVLDHLGTRLLSVTDAAGIRTSTVFDRDASASPGPDRVHGTGRVTHMFGPVAATCFATGGGPSDGYGTGGAPNGTCANSPKPAHTETTYDHDYEQGGASLTGLAATYWTNTNLSSLPDRPSAHGQATIGANGSLVHAIPAGGSGRFTGEISLGTSGDWSFNVTATGGQAKMWVDDILVADTLWSPSEARPKISANLASGLRHRIRVEAAGTSGPPSTSPTMRLRWSPPNGAESDIPGDKVAPRYANATKVVVDDDSGVPSRSTTLFYERWEASLVEKTVQDDGGLSLTTTVVRDQYGRPTDTSPPAGDQSKVHNDYYVGTSDAPCADKSPNQGRMLASRTSPDPDASGGTPAREEDYAYDAMGRVAGHRVRAVADDAAGWVCTAYDRRGRVTSTSYPDGRTVTYVYAVKPTETSNPNPLVTSVSDSAGTITTKVDLLGRVRMYTDVLGNTPDSGVGPTTYAYDQVGRPTSVNGPAGARTSTYDKAGRVTSQSLDGKVLASVPANGYDTAGRLVAVEYPT
ncbi:MAG: PA14 domain-containing protein, partial [Acidimicrobiales bacterium]